MQIESRSASRRGLELGCATALYLFVFVYVLVRIDPRLLYDTQCPAFYTKGWFFQSMAGVPGGLAVYVGAFLSQFCRFAWAGAAVCTLVCVVLCSSLGSLYARLAGARVRLLHLVPAFLFLSAYGDYRCPLAASVGVAGALVVLALYALVFGRVRFLRVVAFVILCPLVYWAFGGAAMLFAALCAVFEFGEKRASGISPVLALFYLAGAAALPWAFSVVFTGLPVFRVYADLLPGLWRGGDSFPMLSLAGYAVLAGVAVALWPVLGKRSTRRPSTDVFPEGETAEPSGGKMGWAFEPVVFVILGAAVFFSFHGDAKALAKEAYYARREMWPELLTFVRSQQDHPVIGMNGMDLNDPGEAVMVIHDVDRALYHTGRLLEDMFSYPQLCEAPALLLSDQKFCLRHRAANLRRAEILFELGRVNHSEHLAHEAWAYHGDRPEIFRRLAKVNVLKGRIEGARTYLARLQATLFDRGWATEYLGQLNQDLYMPSDQELTNVRYLMFTKDYLGTTAFAQEEGTLIRLLHQNSANRMAFEYLMAYYLLKGQSDSVAANVAALPTFGFTRIPRHMEEALLVHLAQYGEGSVDLAGLEIRPETRQRFEEFRSLLSEYGSDAEALWTVLAPSFGNSYWFYQVLGVTGYSEETVPLPYRVVSGAPQ